MTGRSSVFIGAWVVTAILTTSGPARANDEVVDSDEGAAVVWTMPVDPVARISVLRTRAGGLAAPLRFSPLSPPASKPILSDGATIAIIVGAVVVTALVVVGVVALSDGKPKDPKGPPGPPGVPH